MRRLADRQCRSDGTLRVVLMGGRRSKDRIHAIAQKLEDETLILEQCLHHGAEQAIDEGDGLFGGKVASGRDEAAHIGEEDGNEAVLPRQRTLRLGPGEDEVAKNGGHRALGGGIRLLQAGPRGRRVSHGSMRRTRPRHGSAALLTELGGG